MIENFSWFTNTDLGKNSLKLHELAQTFTNATFVDLGVRQGASSYIKVECYPESWGMTFVKIKKKINFKKNIKDWNKVLQKRNELISNYWNSSNVGNKMIELELTND